MGRLLGWALTAQQGFHRRAFESATRDPEGAQTRVLTRLLRGNADTLFGRRHGFATIGSAAEYARRVPIHDYEALRPYVARIMAGETAVLTAEAPFMFTTTSGTTGEPKFIPVTTGWARSMASLMRLWSVYAVRDHPEMLDHQVLTIVGPASEGVAPGGLPYGAMTGLTYQRLPWLIRRRHALPYAAALIREHETRYFVALRLALGRAVSSIGTPNSSTLLRLAEVAARRGDELVRAVHEGTLGVTELEPMPGTGVTGREVRGALTAALRPDPRRAAFLEAIARRRGRLVLGDCWPELALVACWLGGSAGIQARHLDAHFDPRIPRRDLGLVASEGRFTVPIEDDSATGVLAVHTTFYEFVAEEEIDNPGPRTLLCHELVEGHRYYLIVTGANGLYRYDMNDVVEVRGFHDRTPKVAFVRKGRDMLNITGEKLHLNHVLHAMREAERTTGLGFWQFRVIPDVEAGRYDLLVELPRLASAPDAGGGSALSDFAAAFDRGLAETNVEYRSKRASMRLAPPRLCLMRPGWSELLCREEFARGRREIQHKWNVMRPEWDDTSRAEILLSVDGLERAGAGA
jgi:GH3 auxin-responsive promoter